MDLLSALFLPRLAFPSFTGFLQISELSEISESFLSSFFCSLEGLEAEDGSSSGDGSGEGSGEGFTWVRSSEMSTFDCSPEKS